MILGFKIVSEVEFSFRGKANESFRHSKNLFKDCFSCPFPIFPLHIHIITFYYINVKILLAPVQPYVLGEGTP